MPGSRRELLPPNWHVCLTDGQASNGRPSNNVGTQVDIKALLIAAINRNADSESPPGRKTTPRRDAVYAQHLA